VLAVAIVSAAIAAVSGLAAVASWWVSRQMAIAARDSAAASQSSASAAQRSATAAEQSVEIQGREAQAADEQRRRNQLADVVPLYWETGGGEQHRGLVIRNNGPSVARHIVAYVAHRGGSVRKWEWAALAASETTGLLENEKAPSTDDLARIGSTPAVPAEAYALLEWQNADGTQGATDWKAIRHQ